jgi:hypothetical protein
MTNNSVSIANNVKALEGIIKIEKRYADGTKEVVLEKENLITLAAKLAILSSIFSSTSTPDPVATLRVGTGGTVDPEGLYPKAVSSTITGLYTPLTTAVVSYVLNSSVPSVTFIADLDQGSGNGSLITEAGLFKQSGTIFNIKTFPGIAKTSEFSLHFEWTIKIA